MQLPKAQKRIVFYSEGANYWPHLSGLVTELLKSTDIPICYISSDKEDPGLHLTNPNYQTFYIADGYPCKVLFANIETDIMVMTMPDLDNYYLKRSKHKVNYVYVQHSLVSLHMIYRTKAFDNFDTIFCAGKHHIQEIRALEKTYNLPAKNLVEHGYSRLDAIIQETANHTISSKPDKVSKHILIAPSWGENGIIESIGQQLVEILLSQGFKVTLRPHPQTIKLAGDKVEKIVRQNGKNPLFNLEIKMASQESFHQSDLMISDWSGVALEYAFGLNKPVLFFDVPRKVNNPYYEEIDIVPLEVSIRSEIGMIISTDELHNIANKINSLLSDNNKEHEKLCAKTVFNQGAADRVGVKELQKLINANT